MDNRRTQSRRNTPVKGLSENLNYLRGQHSLNFGFAYTRIASFTQAVGTQVIPRINLGLAAGDPVATGSTNIFTTGNFPGSTATQRSQAQTLYAVLVGRVSSINRSASLNDQTRAYGLIPLTEQNHQNEFGYYGQDSWKIRPNLTMNYGLRWEIDPSPVNDNLVYTRPGIDGVFGVSGRPGELGQRIVLYGPWQARFDLNVVKRIRVTERTSFEGRVQFLNAFNRPNFIVGSLSSVNSPLRTISVNDGAFGQTRAAYRDITVSGTNDPGGRIIEFQLRFKF